MRTCHCLFVVCVIVLAGRDLFAAESAADARLWCQFRSFNDLENRGFAPYNWTAATHLEGSAYVTRGEWRVKLEHVKVECRSKRGPGKQGGKFRIVNVEVLEREADK